jgi:hypothetical protein
VDSESVKLNLLLREIQPLRSFDFFFANVNTLEVSHGEGGHSRCPTKIVQ